MKRGIVEQEIATFNTGDDVTRYFDLLHKRTYENMSVTTILETSPAFVNKTQENTGLAKAVDC